MPKNCPVSKRKTSKTIMKILHEKHQASQYVSYSYTIFEGEKFIQSTNQPYLTIYIYLKTIIVSKLT